ncbi:MAG: fatty acid desaturase [Archangiaceae bacterium]|nr:fatty acid desaturase [Archangiaceae bacterium]
MTHSRLLHLRALLIPLTATLFFVLDPVSPLVALAFAVSPFFPPFPRDAERVSTVTVGGMDGYAYALFALQCVNLPLAARTLETHGWLSLSAAVTVVLMAVSSSLCGAIAGHELIHRTGAAQLALGRLLLASVLYEHFFAEHLRGHHVRYATRDDPATARPGESFAAYLWRSPPAQLASAWQLDRSSVMVGLVLEAAIAALFGWCFGASGLAFFLLQAALVHVAFNAVQYFEHWGLEGGSQSWDAEDRASLFGIIGLARHADHHARPGRPFSELELRADSPKLPKSYGGMIGLAIFRNREFQRLMTAELVRLGAAPAPARDPAPTRELA